MSTMQSDLGCGNGDPQRFSDLTVRPTVDVFEYHHGPLRPGQLIEGAPESFPQFEVLSGSFEITGQGYVGNGRRVVERGRRVPSETFLQRPRRIHGDPMNPRLERRVAAKLRQPAPGANERILGDVGRQFRIIDQSGCQSEHSVLVSSYQLLKRISVAFLRQGDQMLFITRFDFGILHRVTGQSLPNR